MLIAFLDIVALVSSTILYFRTRHIYKAEFDELHQHDKDMLHPHPPPHLPSGGANMGHEPSQSDAGLDSEASDAKQSLHHTLQVQHEDRT